jgi:hypothetical protein
VTDWQKEKRNHMTESKKERGNQMTDWQKEAAPARDNQRSAADSAQLQGEQLVLRNGIPNLDDGQPGSQILRSLHHPWHEAILAIVWIACLTVGGAINLAAQTVSGMTGTVTDSSGAVIVGADVAITNESTGVVSHVGTTGVGTYAISGLNPGFYSVTVVAHGFQKYIKTHVNVEVGSVPTVDLKMAPGAETESVQVTTDSIALNTTQMDVGTTLEPKVLDALPVELSGLPRQIDQFIFLSPGVQGSTFSREINGGTNFENEVLFNGIPISMPNLEGQQTYMNPPFEMVNQFRVERATFAAQYGLGQGALTYNMASGTNQLHGDAFEINRNNMFDSDGFFPSNFNAQGKPIPPVDHQNDFGFKIGGPLILPKLYDGRNRTFFLFTSDWFRENQPITSIGTVPTVAMTQGDFSNFVDSSGNQIPIYDPTTGLPFPLNKIPANRFSALANSIIPSIPAPDRTGTNYGLQSNKSPAVHNDPMTDNLYGFTVDHTITQSQSLHFSMWRDNQLTVPYNYAPIVPDTNELQSAQYDYNFATGMLLNYVKTVTSNLVATAGIGYYDKLDGQSSQNLGHPFAGVQNSIDFPNITFNGQNSITDWGVSPGETANTDRQLGLSFVNNWLWTKGRHTLNIGGEARREYEDQQACTACAGEFNFSQAETSTPNSADPNFGSYGSSFASFLLGLVDSGDRILANEMELRNFDISPYIQDDIKLTRRLTINAGLRWDIMVPFTENHNYIVFLNETELDPGAANLPGAATRFGNCVGCAGYDRAAIDWKQFGPRLGVSYQLGDKTVLQAGGFLAYLQGGAYEFGTANVVVTMGNLLIGEFNRNSTGSSTPGYGDWDTNQMPLPSVVPFNPSMGNGNSIPYFNSNLGRAPYVQSWNVTAQRQLPWTMFLTVSYVGNRAVHLPSGLNPINQPNPSILSYGSLLSQPVNSSAAVAAGIVDPYPLFISQFGSGATVEQALKPFPQYTNVQNLYDDAGSSFYNSFQAQAEKRFTNGLSYLASLTFGRDKTNADRAFSAYFNTPLNKYNQRPEYVVSNNDQKYLVRVVTTYELPFGPGHHFFNNKGLTGQILGGWQMSGIFDYEGGTPLQINENGSGIDGFDRPLVVPGVKRQTFNYDNAIDYFLGKLPAPPVMFSTNAFTPTANQYQLGNTARNYATLRNPPLRMEDLDLIKHFSVAEKVKLSIRMDYFNAFNRTIVNGPDTNISDSTFGEVTSEGSAIINRQGQVTFRVEF